MKTQVLYMEHSGFEPLTSSMPLGARGAEMLRKMSV